MLTQTLRNSPVRWFLCDNCVSFLSILTSQLSVRMQGCGGADNSKQQTIQMPFLLGLRIHYANLGQQIYLLYYILLGFILKNCLHSLWMCVCWGQGRVEGLVSLEFNGIIKSWHSKAHHVMQNFVFLSFSPSSFFLSDSFYPFLTCPPLHSISLCFVFGSVPIVLRQWWGIETLGNQT